MTTVSLTKAQVIADQNDLFRQHATTGICVWKGYILQGQLVCTSGIQSLRSDDFDAVLLAVQDFNTFGADNKPHGEHDFGSLEVVSKAGGETINIFWQISYYSTDYLRKTTDEANPKLTHRVLTVMLDSESIEREKR